MLKSFLKVNLIFSFEHSTSTWTNLSKTMDLPVDFQVTKQVQKNFFISYILFEQV